MTTTQRFTWDGLPVAQDEPHGATIVVRRPVAGSAGQHEYLLLHRAHYGPAYAGDWAWTPPAGSRQPGERVLPAALRELAEETGLQAEPADLRVADLSGVWVSFALDVPPGAAAHVDHEHDRLEWVSLAEAVSRCRPDVVRENIRRAAALLRPAIAFRPLAHSDLPDMVRWQQAPHAARWFPENLDLAAAQRKYGPRLSGASPVAMHVMLADGRPCGFLQHYRVDADPEYARAVAEYAQPAGGQVPIGIDYAIGEEALTGRGLGPQLIWKYVREVVLTSHPAARYIVANPDAGNERSVRALRKAGFRRVMEIPGRDGGRPQALCVLDRRHFLG